jgi:hypothetical protein
MLYRLSYSPRPHPTEGVATGNRLIRNGLQTGDDSEVVREGTRCVG